MRKSWRGKEKIQRGWLPLLFPSYHIVILRSSHHLFINFWWHLRLDLFGTSSLFFHDVLFLLSPCNPFYSSVVSNLKSILSGCFKNDCKDFTPSHTTCIFSLSLSIPLLCRLFIIYSIYRYLQCFNNKIISSILSLSSGNSFGRTQCSGVQSIIKTKIRYQFHFFCFCMSHSEDLYSVPHRTLHSRKVLYDNDKEHIVWKQASPTQGFAKQIVVGCWQLLNWNEEQGRDWGREY